MSNKGARLPKPRKRPQKAKKNREHTTLRRVAFGTLSGIGALLGFVVAILTLLPRISVTPSDPEDPNDTLSASFTIANNNFIQLRDVGASLGINEVQPFGKALDKNLPSGISGSYLFRSDWVGHTLDMDDRFTITPADVVHFSTPREASIGIEISFRAWILPWVQKKVFRFDTHRGTNGNLYWFSVPAK